MADGALTLRSHPNEIYFDCESRCFLRCVMCRGTADRKRGWEEPTADEVAGVSLARFRKLERVMATARHIRLTGTGETLLCPDLPVILDIARRNRVFTSLATNGLLIDADMAAMLIRKGLGEIVVSVDAACKETYEKIRPGASWETLLEALVTLDRARKEVGGSSPRLIFSGNFSQLNIEELPGFINLAATYGAAGVYVFKTMFFDSSLKQHDLSHFPEMTYRCYLEAVDLAKHHGLTFSNWLVREKELNEYRRTTASDCSIAGEASGTGGGRLVPSQILQRCSFPWTGLRVEMNGRVRVCCAQSILLGNIDEQPFEEIWNSPAAQAMRRLFLEGRPPEGCRNCSLITESNDLATTDAIPTAFERQGYLDSPAEGETCGKELTIRGWIFNPIDIAGISVYVDGLFHRHARCSLERPDVISSHPGLPRDARPGFSCTIDTASLENGYHLLHLRILDNRGEARDRFHTTVRIANRR